MIPEFAKSCEVLDEGRSYVFHLVDGVTFHDGTDFEAEAAKRNFDRILDPETGIWRPPFISRRPSPSPIFARNWGSNMVDGGTLPGKRM